MTLMEQYTLAGMKLKNRIVRAATFEKRADENGRVTDALIEMYQQLARGQCGLIITGSALVHPSGRYLRRMISAHSDIYIDGLGQLADAVHEAGGLIALQINHGGRQCSSLMLGGGDSYAPSAIFEPETGTTPHAMQDHEIWTIAEAFASAALRAQTAGFDAVEIQAAHGYLISSFLSPHTNLRDDYWGGDPMRRFHFLEEVLKATRKAVGGGFPIIVKLNAEDHVEGGLKLSDSLYYAQQLQGSDVNAVEISGGLRDARTAHAMAGMYREAGALFKRELDMPVILTGGFRKVAEMQEAIDNNEADMVGMARALICEPDLPLLMQEGKQEAQCDFCSECLRLSRHKTIECVKTKPLETPSPETNQA